MNDRIKAILTRILEFWNKYTSKQKTMIISIGAAVIFMIALLVSIITRTNYEVLTAFETTKETAEAAGYLDDAAIVYKTSDDGLTIEVDKSKVAEARLVLGENGMSDSSKADYSTLFDSSMTTTDAEKKLKQKIFLQQDIADSLETIDGVKQAIVAINIPEDTNSIYKNEEQSYASIMLTTTSDFSEDSVESIASFVSNELGCNNTDNIRIVDQKGQLLFSGNTGGGSSSTATLTLKERVVDDMESSIRRLLINSGIYNDAEVMANLDISLDEEEVLDTMYYSNADDDTGPKDSQYTYTAENVDGTGGVVGTDSNGEEITDYNLTDTGAGSSNVTVYREEYSTSSTVTNTKKAIGTVDPGNSSVAIILSQYVTYDEAKMKDSGELDGTTFDEFEAANGERKAVEVTDEVYSIVEQATGIKANSIQILAYQVPVFYPEESAFASGIFSNVLTILLFVLIVGLLVFVVLKGMKPVEVTETEPELSVEALLATTKENQNLDDIEFSDKSATRQQIEKFVDENPEAVASLLRNWLNDEWE